jgi:predicted HTH domain antitoxin
MTITDDKAAFVDTNVLLSATAPGRPLHRAALTVLNDWPNRGTLLVASKLFELRRLSLGKASELAGISRIHFMDELGRPQIPVINLTEDQIRDELRDD